MLALHMQLLNSCHNINTLILILKLGLLISEIDNIVFTTCLMNKQKEVSGLQQSLFNKTSKHCWPQLIGNIMSRNSGSRPGFTQVGTTHLSQSPTVFIPFSCVSFFQVVRQGEILLEKIQGALSDIAQCQLDMQNPALILNKDVKPQL